MSRHDDSVRIEHMLMHAREAVELASGKSRSDLDRERLLNLGLVRLVEVVGEASSRVSEAGQSRYPNVPWAQIRGMRNRLIHGYDAVDFDILWDVIRLDLPALIAELERGGGPEGQSGA